MDISERTAQPTFRTATPADVPAVVTLVESAYRGDSSRVGWTTEADILQGQRTDPEGVVEVIEKAGSRLVLVERAGELIACCHIERRGDNAYFGMFAVRPTAQAGGLGKTVLAEAERYAATEWDAAQMHMTVITARADLIAWYERRGYTRTGETHAFPYGDERFGVPQRDDLEFELLVKDLKDLKAAATG
ncbi:GNAT family N-acetyltransferase [Streptomyces sp. So13.3]|uniref:GNAT family N-acetyltransferase n=1 Tax=Streptomyces TaxID=1883 RepID=UPI001105DBDD|nr:MULTISPECIES: GNAT family N-acetyltransferase [Streptomyces]MCZ4099213.1 GNAT family N-acetyltransferase [Streptomyces sp. H39-C1]QNA72205.1 GNAT family N-acetyltransferase [Streptomyces sp. So13.3]